MGMRIKNMRLWVAVGIAAAFLGFFFWQNSRREERSFRIIFIPKVIDEDNDFWKLLIEGVEMAAAENKMELTIVAPEREDDYEAQNELIEWAIGQKPDAILLTPSSFTETTPYAKKVTEEGIPLILVDSAIDEDIGDTLITTDNEMLGEVEGNYMKQYATKDSQIVIVGHVEGSSTAIEREKGVRKGLGEYEDRIVDVVFCDSDYDKAYELMMDLIEKYPDIDLVAGLNEYSAVGAARAIKEKGLHKGIRVVGIDSSLEEIQMLEEGVFEIIVIQNPFKMGYLGVEAAKKLLNGEKVPKYIDSGCELIKNDSVYTEENQKLLFPFREE
ncbi:MAG: substrate-binding domain-containing protein [Kineothrix sp.]|nr:substrate-binding domain-containing protein [Kineothrix sp.]NBI90296.1 sugar ABC transporter substrate-binding protein [Lachnospiraceae bacterium]